MGEVTKLSFEASIYVVIVGVVQFMLAYVDPLVGLLFGPIALFLYTFIIFHGVSKLIDTRLKEYHEWSTAKEASES